jgi:hypothetical protein
MLPGEREQALKVGLQAAEFASENHAVFRPVAVPPFDDYVDTDACILCERAGNMKFARFFRVPLLEMQTSHGLLYNDGVGVFRLRH